MEERLSVFFLGTAGLLGLLALFSACIDTVPRDEEATSTPTPTSQRDTNTLPKEELETLETELNSTDVAIEIEREPEQVRPGDEIEYEVTVTNYGPNPADEVQVIDALPDAVRYLNDNSECHEESTQEVVCDLGEIPARGSVTIAITGQVDPDALAEDSDSATIRNVVTVENLAGPDPAPDNNRATDETEVVVSAPVSLIAI